MARPEPLIVVSNTSPITNLAAVGQFELLHSLFGDVFVSPATLAELEFGGQDWPGAAEVRTSPWVIQQAVDDQTLVDALRLDLDRGEAEAIALALQLRADLVLLDERPARLAAQYLGLNVMGVVGMLVQARHVRLIRELRPLLDSLRNEAGFYIDQPLYQHALTLVNEA